MMENVEFDGEDATIRIKSKMFSFDVVKSAAYVLLDRAYFSFGGDPEGTFEVYVKSKEGEDVKEVVQDFQNELVNYSVYEKEADRNREIREAITKRALATNLEGEIENMKDVEEFLSPQKKGEDE